MCTGSGAIGIAINKKTNAQVVAVDVSDGAIALAKENAEITLAILNGEKGPRRNAVLLNWAAGLYVAGKVESLEDGIKLAEEIIDSGKALNQLERFIEVTNR